MKKKITLVHLGLILSLALPLFSCQQTTSSRWSLSAEDIDAIEEGEVYQYFNEDGSRTFELAYYEPVIKQAITDDDIRLIDKTKAAEAIQAEGYASEFIDEKTINQYSVASNSITCSDDLTDVQIKFTGDENDAYALLISKDVTANGSYVLLEPEEMSLTIDGLDSSVVFEETYCSEKFTWENGGSFAVSVLSNIAGIAASCYANSLPGIVGGITNILTSIGNTFCASKGVNLTQMYTTINSKLDNITANLTKNFNLLQNESIQEQLKIDHAILLQYQQAIGDFNTNYVFPIENFNTVMKNEMSNYINDIVDSGDKKLDLWFSKDNNNQWSVSNISDIDKATMTQVSVDISSFSNSKTFLENNKHTVSDGFNAELEKDIQNACTYVSCPEGMTSDELADAAYTNFMETLMQKYFTDNSSKASELQVMVENESASIYGGGIGNKSVIDDYAERLKYMYNFAGEANPVLTTIFSKILSQLDNATATAALGLGYKHYDSATMATKYKAARNYIQDTYTNLKKYQDNYCYTTNCNLEGDFYSYGYNTNYSNQGNHPTLSVSTTLSKFTGIPMSGTDTMFYFPTIDSKGINGHNWVDSISLRKISARYSLLREMGVIDADTEFSKYLKDCGAISENGYRAFQSFSVVAANKSYYNRIFSGVTNERDFNDSDTKYRVRCMGIGNPKGSYYNYGSSYNYASSRGSDHWKGRLQESEFISGTNGTSLSDNYLACWATFNESHWYWRNDEHWGFVGEDSLGSTVTFFFGVEKVA